MRQNGQEFPKFFKPSSLRTPLKDEERQPVLRFTDLMASVESSLRQSARNRIDARVDNLAIDCNGSIAEARTACGLFQ